MSTTTVTLKTGTESLSFDRQSGRLVSFRSKFAPGQEFIASSPEHPVFVLQYLDRQRQYRRLTSHDARSIRIVRARRNGADTLTMTFGGIGGLDLAVTATVRISPGEAGSRWGLTFQNGTGLDVVDIQYPFVVVSYDLRGALLSPWYAGRLLQNPVPETLGPDAEDSWHFSPVNGSSSHYPGGMFAQFLAYYNERAGLYLACEDSAAHVKLIKTLHRPPGIRMGIAHVGDWPRQGRRVLEYETVLRSFKGDWHAAADLYRSWTLGQKWATPLHRRTDIPPWLLDSPAYITLRLQGELDIGPVFPVKEFLPYEKALPLLGRLAKRIGSPLVAVLMSWERGGPWVYPDCFPPAGGEKSLRRFTALARRRGWHVGSYCNGTRWVMKHMWNDYDGRDFFRKHDGRAGVCRTPEGDLWQETWDRTFRPSYVCCHGARATRRIAEKFIERLVGWGMESIQFFDQNMGATTFPCFAKDHEHPPVPGRWMAAGMRKVMESFRRAAHRAGEQAVMHSTEAPCNETCLPFFQQCDVRVIPPGHVSNYDFMPLYHYLYHECITLQGGMGMGPEPHHLPIRNACNAVLGEIPGAVMIGDGTLLNKDTGNWANWEPRVGSDDDAVAMLRSVTATRRGAGRDFLLFGRMLRDAEVEGIRTIAWEQNSRMHRIPAVFHAAWQAPDGRTGVVLSNWTGRPQKISLRDDRLGRRPVAHYSGRRLTSQTFMKARTGTTLEIIVPPLGCALIHSPKN